VLRIRRADGRNASLDPQVLRPRDARLPNWRGYILRKHRQLEVGDKPVMTLTRLGGRRDAAPQARLRLPEESWAGGMSALDFEALRPPTWRGIQRGGQN